MDSELVTEAHGLVRERMCGKILPESGLREDLQRPLYDLEQLLKRTIEFGESNSALVIGPRGCGKSALMRQVLCNVKKDKNISENLMEVHLNGLMQTDDRIALTEITRQLKLENVIGDRVFGSFSENLTFLLQALRTGVTSTSCPIVFVLDEFDLFALHKNQTLLYNLFDITQAGTTPMAVIGLTCRLDVMDLFEKRVKSRFSHRQIYLSNSWTFEEYVQALKDSLSLPKDFARKRFVKTWNEFISNVIQDESALNSLQSQFCICKEIAPLYTILALAVGRLDPSRGVAAAVCDIVDSISSAHADSKANMLHGVSVLELCLVIAMHHLTCIYDAPFNFQMVYNEYLKFAKRKSHILQNYPKPVVMKAFEHLVELELVKPFDSNLLSVYRGCGSKLQKEYRLMSVLVERSQLNDAVHKYRGCPTDVKQWATSSLE